MKFMELGKIGKINYSLNGWKLHEKYYIELPYMPLYK
jgi:hypothetical protein